MQQLEAEKKKSGMLEARNVEMRKRMGIQQTALEAEEELITNKLISRIEEIEKEKEHVSLRVEEEENQLRSEKAQLESKLQHNTTHLARLKKEKEDLVRQVEQEEEFLTNTLQHKLSKVLAEKVEIENRLEQEQEYISNRLQKQAAQSEKEKKEMEERLDEQKMLVHQMMQEKDKLAHQLQELRLTVEIEEESISNKLGKAVAQTKVEKDLLMVQLERERAAASQLSKEHETQRDELKKLQGANHMMQKRITKEAKRLQEFKRDKSHLAQSLEAEWEWKLNNLLARQREASNDGHSISSSFDRAGSHTMRDRAGSLNSTSECQSDLDVDFDKFTSGEMDRDVVGELAATPRLMRNPSRGRSWKWESQSLPCFSPRLSPYPSPPATPYSSRSRSPSSFRAASPAQDPFTTRSRSPTTDRSSHSSLSGAETLGVVAHPAANQAASLPIPPPPAALNFMFAPFGGSGAGKNPSPHQHRAGVAGLSSIEDGEGIDAAPIVGSPPPAAER